MSTRRFISTETDLNVYCLIRRTTDGQLWRTSAFEAYSSANYSDYAIDCPEQGDSGTYEFTMPSAIGAGTYDLEFRSTSGSPSSPTEGDTFVDAGVSEWDGTGFVTMRGTDDAPTAAQIRTEMDNESVQLAKIDALDSEIVTALQSTVAEQVRVALENGKVTVALQDPMDESSPLVYTYYAPNGTTAVVRHTVPQDQSGRTIEVLV